MWRDLTLCTLVAHIALIRGAYRLRVQLLQPCDSGAYILENGPDEVHTIFL